MYHLRYGLLPVSLAVVTLAVTLPVVAKADDATASKTVNTTMPAKGDEGTQTTSYRDQWLKGRFRLGALGTVRTSPYRGADNADFGGLPTLAFDSERLHVGLDGIRAKIVQGNWGSVSILGNVRMKPFDDDDSSYLRGLHERDWAFETGVAYDRRFGPGNAHIEFLHDVSGEHEGKQFDATYKVPFQTGRFKYELGGGVMWRDSDLNNYYVEVRPNEARADRAAYSADSAFLPHLDASVAYQLTAQMMVRANASATFLPNEYTDSSIIEDDVIYGVGLGLVYQF
ncbi:MipA/OmpV family protein [Thalassospira sp. TSL5-1]|uniref:MipA/OmpV family protein n=1 Tax=Thalassospira sp. TSL5-1 TaxID=1544451 RepID=UPI000A40BE6D|nr:MipA/OmpV family protein [Thalassospira sp. TSL5-1]